MTEGEERTESIIIWIRRSGIRYHPSTAGEGKMDPVLVHYREGRPPKTSGNPYYYLGEPIGDLREEHVPRPQALPLAKEIKIEKAESWRGSRCWFYLKRIPKKKEDPVWYFSMVEPSSGGSAETVEEPCRLLAGFRERW